MFLKYIMNLPLPHCVGEREILCLLETEEYPKP
jgi:hypothetical protein